MKDLEQQITDIIKYNTPKNITLPFNYVSNDIDMNELISYNREILRRLSQIEMDLFRIKNKLEREDLNIYRG